MSVQEVTAANGKPGSHGATVLSVQSLRLSFGGLVVLDDLSFDLYDGEVIGLIGPNGAGKTALLNCLTGFYRPDSGSIMYGDKELVGERTGAIASAGISRTFQEAASMGQLGARDLMLLGRERFLPAGVFKFATPAVRSAERGALERVRAVAHDIGILDHIDANTLLGELPYGVRKLADLGRALVAEPQILLMDEPAAGLNRSEKELMASVIGHTHARRGLTQVLVDHDIDFVSAICDRLVVLNAGLKIAEGDVATVLRMREVVESYIGVPVDDVATLEEDQASE